MDIFKQTGKVWKKVLKKFWCHEFVFFILMTPKKIKRFGVNFLFGGVCSCVSACIGV
jgi:hypothetical protein